MPLTRRASLLLPLSLVGCVRPKTAEGVAEAFLDGYYVEQDHAKALELCEGGAALRLRGEQKLVAEAGGAYGVQPRVFYKLSGKKPRGAGQELIYTLGIESGGVKMNKEVHVVAEPRGDAYKVTFFDERDVLAQ